MKDRQEAKFFLYALPALLVWELLYQFVLVPLIPAAENRIVHSLGFVVLVTVVWVFLRRKAETEEEE